jgi:hypothetical protein
MVNRSKLQTKVHNLKEITQHLQGYQYATEQGWETGIVRAAYRLLQLSLNLVPVDTGYLRSTAKVVESGRGFDKVAKVIYSAAYSIWVHERLDLAHGAEYNRKYAEDIASGRKHMRRPQEQAKFIETPLRTNRIELISVVREDMKESARRVRSNNGSKRRRSG